MRIQKLGYTKCADGITVSTIGCPGLGQCGGDYETALIGRDYTAESVARYKTAAEAFSGHARLVAEHGSAQSFIARLFGCP